MKRKLEEIEIILCRCYSSEHQILVHYDEEDNELYMDDSSFGARFLETLEIWIKIHFRLSL
jgi:hypothetical protein